MYAKDNIPLYFRMYHKIKQHILSGEFDRGSKIGIIGDLSKKYGVAPETMRRALFLLESEGLLVRKQGVGTIIPETANLDPIAIAQLVVHKKVVATIRKNKFTILSAKWVPAPRRVMKLYNMEQASAPPLVYEISHKLSLKDNLQYRVVSTHYLNEHLLSELKLEKDTQGYDVLLALAHWIDDNTLTLTESLRPYLCTDEHADLLNLPDGTPVFYHDYFACDSLNRCHYWESLSTANLHRHVTTFQ